jgi:hypothetical protein
MMRAMTVTLSIGAALTLAACANNDSIFNLGDSSPQPTAALPAKPAVDPTCVSLAQRIEALRKDGVVDRVEAAAKGKGTTVSVKRASLTQIAELEKANADFQAKCSTVPRTASSAQPMAPAATAQPPAKTAAVAPVAKTPSPPARTSAAEPQRSGGE